MPTNYIIEESYNEKTNSIETSADNSKHNSSAMSTSPINQLPRVYLSSDKNVYCFENHDTPDKNYLESIINTYSSNEIQSQNRSANDFATLPRSIINSPLPPSREQLQLQLHSRPNQSNSIIPTNTNVNLNNDENDSVSQTTQNYEYYSPPNSSLLNNHNWWQHMLQRSQNMSKISKIFLLFTIAFFMAQLVACVVILALTWNQACDAPLSIFLLIYCVRLAASIPLIIFSHLGPQERSRSNLIFVWISRIKVALDVSSIIVFIIGNCLVFTSISCRSTAPMLYYFCIGLIILGYFILAIPLFLCGAFIFCLPCLVVALRIFHLGDIRDFDDEYGDLGLANPRNCGASKDVIDSLPIFMFDHNLSLEKFGLHNNDHRDNRENSIDVFNSTTDRKIHSLSTSTDVENSNQHKPSYLEKWKLWLHQSKSKTSFANCQVESNCDNEVCQTVSSSPRNQTNPRINILYLKSPEDNLCTICLTQYTHQELVKQLDCNHHYHVHCLDKWLAIRADCPLCKRLIDSEPTFSS